MDCHKVRFRAVSHNSVRCLKILLKFFVNVYRCDPLARFPGSLPLSARFSIFSLRITFLTLEEPKIFSEKIESTNSPLTKIWRFSRNINLTFIIFYA